MIEAIKNLLSDLTHDKTKEQKLEFIQKLGYESFQAIVELKESDLKDLKERLIQMIDENMIVTKFEDTGLVTKRPDIPAHLLKVSDISFDYEQKPKKLKDIYG